MLILVQAERLIGFQENAMKKLFLLFMFMLFVVAEHALYAQSSILLRKTDWTVPEVKEWAAKNKEQRWHGRLLYEGSDSLYHHFVSRVMDEWVWFRIKRADLVITDERMYRTTSSATSQYYYVDALDDFRKVKD